MNKVKIGIIVLVVIALFTTGCSALSSYTSVYDTNIKMKADYTQLINNRSSAYANMVTTIKQKMMVTKMNDTSFQKIVKTMMEGQKDGENVTWKWVQQSNPAASFSEVSAMYKDVSRQIEGDRKTIVEKERLIGLLVAEQEKLLSTFWAHFFFGGEELLKDKYKPITSSAMEEINKTGKDDDISL